MPTPRGKRGPLVPLLQLDRRPEGLAGRGEHDQRLVTPELEEDAFARLHDLACQIGEGSSERGRGLVAVLLRVFGVPADVGDQEGTNVGLVVRALRGADVGIVASAIGGIARDGSPLAGTSLAPTSRRRASIHPAERDVPLTESIPHERVRASITIARFDWHGQRLPATGR